MVNKYLRKNHNLMTHGERRFDESSNQIMSIFKGVLENRLRVCISRQSRM